MTASIKKFVVLFSICIGLFGCGNGYRQQGKVETTPMGHLKDVFKHDFLVGAAVNEQLIAGKDSLGLTLVIGDYNAISPENVMKWMYIHPEPESFYFGMTDKYIDFGLKNNLYIVGHTLVWHSQLPDYLNEVKDSFLMAQYLENHINTLVTRYEGKLDAWDVVNEALNEDGTLRRSIFSKYLGDNYIGMAFALAAKADPEVKLIYNDYNLWKPLKRKAVLRLVRQLQAKGIKIDGIGLQGHWSLKGPPLEEIEKSIVAFSDLGLKVHITELDITVLPNPWDLEGAEISQNFDGSSIMNPYKDRIPDSIQNALANRYQDVFRLFLKHSDKIDRVTFWGINDQVSWLNDWPIKGRTNYPLLFDRKYKAKIAYDSIIALKKEIASLYLN
tara:strand:- start:4171 stop:5328 length:1158 start_codon:yes stop_codon:yes gene_type:complete